jgi:hydroxymethylglutaryl-CoA lyase
MKFIECPRDAMQGITEFIPTELKVNYINQLLKVGFDTIDVGSFVSKKMIPQLADTADVLKSIDISSSKSKLLVIVGNERGAEEAVAFDEVTYIGFPFSISQTFQEKNINSSIDDSLRRLGNIQNLAMKNNKKLVTYFSMAFGNPYGDEWSVYIVAHWVEKLWNEFGINILSLSDTVGSSEPKIIEWLFSKLIKEFPAVEIGAHLHTHDFNWKEKLEAAYRAGCLRYDGALLGYGGCPMAKDDLVGNMPTEKMLNHFKSFNPSSNIDYQALDNVYDLASKFFK